MAKYHLSANGPRPCHASVRDCPVGGVESHYATHSEAQAAYDEKMTQTFGSFETIKHSGREKARQGSYRNKERLLNFGKKIATSPVAIKAVNAAYAIHTAPQRSRSLALRNIQRLNAFALKLQSKAKDHAIKLEKARSDIHAAQVEHYRQIKLKLAQANDAVENRVMFSNQKAVNVRLGQKLQDGSKVIGMTVLGDGKVQVTTKQDNGNRVQSQTLNTNDTIKVESSARRTANKMRNSEFSKRLKTAGSLQKEVLVTLFGVHRKVAQESQLESGRMLNQIHGKKSDYARFA